ncbi:hypothetical protein HPB51_026774 [Rhipicephalus microplus]|uniref:Uncharacterized protein n=1 Tax=Rhipicephalus microplus TaxID=6941 RepID=A0A9J6D1X7_RHIMP|nr:hypothetical protein HPB51_026774 [Rhipicephalus microplus]
MAMLLSVERSTQLFSVICPKLQNVQGPVGHMVQRPRGVLETGFDGQGKEPTWTTSFQRRLNTGLLLKEPPPPPLFFRELRPRRSYG